MNRAAVAVSSCMVVVVVVVVGLLVAVSQFSGRAAEASRSFDNHVKITEEPTYLILVSGDNAGDPLLDQLHNGVLSFDLVEVDNSIELLSAAWFDDADKKSSRYSGICVSSSSGFAWAEDVIKLIGEHRSLEDIARRIEVC